MRIRTSRRRLGPALAAGALVLAGLGFTGAAFACGPTGAHGHGGKPDKVIVLSDRRERGDGDRRVRVVHADGAMALADCDGERTAVSESTGGERTRVVLCSKGNLSAEQRIEKLERALARIGANDELSAEHKEKVTAALREAIERLRSAH